MQDKLQCSKVKRFKKIYYSRDETWKMLMNRTGTIMSHTFFSMFAAGNNSPFMNPSHSFVSHVNGKEQVEINNMTLDRSDLSIVVRYTIIFANYPENERDIIEMDMPIEARASIVDHARQVTMFESEEIQKNIL